MSDMDKKTFGNSPAAIYLVDRLSQLDQPSISRKISRTLSRTRKVINEVITAQSSGCISTATVGFIVESLRVKVDATFALFIDQHKDNPDAVFVFKLANNVAIGEIKSMARKLSVARKIDTIYARNTPDGEAPSCASLESIKDRITSDVLIERSRQYLARKGKINTFY